KWCEVAHGNSAPRTAAQVIVIMKILPILMFALDTIYMALDAFEMLLVILESGQSRNNTKEHQKLGFLEIFGPVPPANQAQSGRIEPPTDHPEMAPFSRVDGYNRHTTLQPVISQS
ncbi:MAG: hypothetical protein ACETWQ_11245, partial [Phycisphaerae bacterium]